MPAANGQIVAARPCRPATGEGKSSRRLSEMGARTYKPRLWGVQHKDRQREDALDLDKAAKRDHDAFEKAVAERDYDKVD